MIPGIIGIKLDYKSIIVTALIGAGAVWLAKKGIEKAVPDIKEAANAVDPLNNDNVIVSWFNRAYSTVTGSPDTLGEDIADMRFKP